MIKNIKGLNNLKILRKENIIYEGKKMFLESNKSLVVYALKVESDDGKIEFSIERDILKIEDIDLDESEVEELLDLFDENDIFEELDMDDDWDDDWDDDSYEDDEQW
jgi:hypothetical protein